MDGKMDCNKEAKEGKKLKTAVYRRVASSGPLTLEEQKKILESRRKEAGEGGR